MFEPTTYKIESSSSSSLTLSTNKGDIINFTIHEKLDGAGKKYNTIHDSRNFGGLIRGIEQSIHPGELRSELVRLLGVEEGERLSTKLLV